MFSHETDGIKILLTSSQPAALTRKKESLSAEAFRKLKTNSNLALTEVKACMALKNRLHAHCSLLKLSQGVVDR